MHIFSCKAAFIKINCTTYGCIIHFKNSHLNLHRCFEYLKCRCTFSGRHFFQEIMMCLPLSGRCALYLKKKKTDTIVYFCRVPWA